ncbi:MAG TPA: hypothetical protein VK914_12470 [bacterium]|nr:hypothetical protein [bacterium]
MIGIPGRAKGLSFVTPVAYDHRFAWAAIASYYGIADEIVLGLDKDRVSWNGKPFQLDEGDFRRRLKAADPDGKITLVEGDFHSRGSAPANDTHERNALSLACKPGNWVVQIDSDELLQNPQEFRAWLLKRWRSWRVLGRWIVVFKRFGEDYLVVDKDSAWISLATRRRGRYTGCRDTKEMKRHSPLRMLHFSWGRDEAELKQKLESWTHARDFDTAKFFDFWKSVDLDNYRSFRDFHPLDGPDWPSLRLIRKGDPDWVGAAF